MMPKIFRRCKVEAFLGNMRYREDDKYFFFKAMAYDYAQTMARASGGRMQYFPVKVARENR